MFTTRFPIDDIYLHNIVTTQATLVQIAIGRWFEYSHMCIHVHMI